MQTFLAVLIYKPMTGGMMPEDQRKGQDENQNKDSGYKMFNGGCLPAGQAGRMEDRGWKMENGGWRMPACRPGREN